MNRILLVDDDDTLRQVLGVSLFRLGYEVVEARDGREALHHCAVRLPEIVLTDILMPNQEGLETISRLRRLYPQVKIIAMSGGGRTPSIDYLKIAKQMGAHAVLAKPFGSEALEEALAQVAD
jgi:CheY-like chemotaxis protein